MSNGSAMSSLASLPVDGQLPSNWYCWQGGWQIFQHPVGLPTALEAGEESHRRDLSSVFMTVGDAVTRSVLLWQPSELCRVLGSADTSLARHSDPRLLHSQEDLRHIHLLRVSPVRCAPRDGHHRIRGVAETGVDLLPCHDSLWCLGLPSHYRFCGVPRHRG